MEQEKIKKVYDATNIQEILGLSRTKTYNFLEEIYMKQEPFRIIKVGKLYKVPMIQFDAWLSGIDK